MSAPVVATADHWGGMLLKNVGSYSENLSAIRQNGRMQMMAMRLRMRAMLTLCSKVDIPRGLPMLYIMGGMSLKRSPRYRRNRITDAVARILLVKMSPHIGIDVAVSISFLFWCCIPWK